MQFIEDIAIEMDLNRLEGWKSLYHCMNEKGIKFYGMVSGELQWKT